MLPECLLTHNTRAAFFGLFTFGMTVTSISLAMDNYTQVERIGAKQAVHILAVLKPSRIEPHPGTNEPVLQPYYKEITYPLDAGVPPNADYYQPAGMPRIKIFSHTRQSQSIANSGLPRLEDIGNASAAPAHQLEGSPPNGGFSVTEHPIDCQDPSPPMKRENGIPAQGAAPQEEPIEPSESRPNPPMRERVTERDLQATRTFAILPMLQAGDNPWDLGSRLLNFKTVMGPGLLDWLLPIRRSPCCDHEDITSQYAIGPRVDELKSSVGFNPRRDSGTPHRRRRRKRSHRTSRSANAMHFSDPNTISGQPNSSIRLQNIHGPSPPSA